MTTKPSNWMRRLAAIMTSVMVFTSFVGQASARILFQDDTVGVWESDQLQIGSNDAGAVDTSIKFGADATEANNGLVNWDTATQTLQITAGDGTATAVDITGDLSADGKVDFISSTEFHIRETADHTTAVCTTLHEIVLDTTDSKIYKCTVVGSPGTWTSTSPSTSNFEAVYSADGDQTLTTSNGAFTIAAGSGAVAVDSTGGIALNDSINGAVDIATGTSTGLVTIGGGAGTAAINTSDWDISATGVMTGIGAITMDGLLTGTLGATISGATTSINASSNFATNIGTGTSTGLVSIGGGSGTAAIDTTSWDITSAGAASGFTGMVSTGTVNFSGATAFRVREVAANPNTLPQICTTVGELIVDTTTGILYTCTDAGADTWTASNSGGNATTLDTLDSTQFLRSDTSDNFTSGTLTLDSGTTLAVNGIATIGDGGDTVAINSSDWDISATGAMTGISGITNDAAFTTSGGAVSVNNNSNFATDINTGTSTGAVSIGGGSNTVAVNSSTWDISTAGAASGFTTFTGSGDITTTGGDLVIGAIGLNDVGVSNVTSGASLVGVFDEFDNSASTTVQGVLNDLDALIGSNADNVEVLTFYPEYPDTVVWPDTSNNAGTLSSLYDDTNDEHYYHWTSNNGATQDMDLKFRFPLPADFASTGDFTFRFRTGSVTEADNDVEMRIYDATDAMALCGTDATNVSAGAWTTATITAATLSGGCAGLSAGDIIEVDVKLMDNSGAGDYADVGYVSLAYNN